MSRRDKNYKHRNKNINGIETIRDENETENNSTYN